MRPFPAFLSPILATLLCGVCTVARPAAVTAAAATVRATQVQVDDDDAHGAFEERGNAICVTPGSCSISFSTVATGHRRLVEKVSCFFFIGTPGTLAFVSLNAASSGVSAPSEYLTITRSFGYGGAGYFVDVSTKFPFEGGETPVITAQSEQTSTEMQCTITGRDIVLP